MAGDRDTRRPPLDGTGDLELPAGLGVTGDLDLPRGPRVTGDFERRRCAFAGDPAATAAAATAAAAAVVSLRPRDCDATPLGILEALTPPPAGVLLLSADLVDRGVLSGTLRLAVPLPKGGGEALPPPPLLLALLGESAAAAAAPLRNGVEVYPGGGGLLAEPLEDEAGSAVETRLPTGGVRLPEAAFMRVAVVAWGGREGFVEGRTSLCLFEGWWHGGGRMWI